MRLFQASEEDEPEKKEVSELRSELWEKEMKLTDIRLEALNSAHQLDQLRETMHNMQVSVLAGWGRGGGGAGGMSSLLQCVGLAGGIQAQPVQPYPPTPSVLFTVGGGPAES